jgi:hypothetical protein
MAYDWDGVDDFDTHVHSDELSECADWGGEGSNWDWDTDDGESDNDWGWDGVSCE